MTIYEKQTYSGDAWFRGTDGKKISGNFALSAFGEKYQNISQTLYWDLTSNFIKRLDVIQDVIIVETPSGFFIDKFEISGGIPVPSDNYNNSVTFSDSYSLDYWFDEDKKKIYTFCGGISAFPSSYNIFECMVSEFDIPNNSYILNSTFSFQITSNSIGNFDPIKICYNKDTKIFNLSTIFNIVSSTKSNFLTMNLENIDTFSPKNVLIILPD